MASFYQNLWVSGAVAAIGALTMAVSIASVQRSPEYPAPYSQDGVETVAAPALTGGFVLRQRHFERGVPVDFVAVVSGKEPGVELIGLLGTSTDRARVLPMKSAAFAIRHLRDGLVDAVYLDAREAALWTRLIPGLRLRGPEQTRLGPDRRPLG